MDYFLPAFEDLFSRSPIRVSQKGNLISFNCSELSTLQWKGQRAQLSHFDFLFKKLPKTKISSETLEFDANASLADFLEVKKGFTKWLDVLACDNLDNLSFWGMPNLDTIMPNGFGPEGAANSIELLEKIQGDGTIVKEKKSFVMDLEKSSSSWLVSVGDTPGVLIDAAAQVSSISIGYNDSSKGSMSLRPELWSNYNTGQLPESWDAHQAFCELLKNESGFQNVWIVNSGAEASEVALKACLNKYPSRRKIIAFENSFHGRTVLTLHATHNADKRLPFELSTDLVTFLPFPENKNPSQPSAEPSEWTMTWANPSAAASKTKIESWKNSGDSLLAKEIDVLHSVEQNILSQNEKPLAVLIEPIQCEGGDRYATPRFFRALRLLTRFHDVALILDEVQSFGLGDTLFWFKTFQFCKADGKTPDAPDAIYLAKKSQVGVCLSNINMDCIPLETSLASVYRGYLQVLASKDFDSTTLKSKVRSLLGCLQKTLGNHILLNPRNSGIAFAFDVKDTPTLNALIEERFKAGTIFYPAGSCTARFRLMTTVTDRELMHMFLAIYRCFENLSAKGSIEKVPPSKQFKENLPEPFQALLKKDEELSSQPRKLELLSPFESDWSKPDPLVLLQKNQEEWNSIFSKLMRTCPWLLRHPVNSAFSIEQINAFTPDTLWKTYQNTPNMSWIECLWIASRSFGYKIEHITSVDAAKKLWGPIEKLEELLYEPARQDDPATFVKASEHENTIFLICRHPAKKEELAGLCVAGPLSAFTHVPLVDSDFAVKDPSALYSIDLSVHSDFQGKGLGLRLKTEQVIQAANQGASLIRSRNRFPDAAAMIRMNLGLGAVVNKVKEKCYGGEATAYYQSLYLNDKNKHTQIHPLASPFTGAMKNKLSLVNFVSPAYIANLRFWRNVVPENMRHLFLASGRAESIDKLVKLFRYKRPKAHKLISFAGDYFGSTTACSRSLGGNEKNPDRYFSDWPIWNWPKQEGEFDQLFKNIGASEDYIGIFVEPLCEKTKTKKDSSLLKKLVEVARKNNIPVLFHETASGFFNYDQKNFFASHSIHPDGLAFYCGEQVGFVACTKDYFLDKPLMMISTWEGDEHSLNLVTDRSARIISQRKH